MLLDKVVRYEEKTIHYTSWIANVIAVIFLAIMMLLTVTDVFLRYFFNKPVMGSMELTEYFMVVAGFLGIAWYGLKKKHLKVGLIVDQFPNKAQAICDCITYFLSLTVVPLIVWQNYVQANYSKTDNVVSDLLEVPAYPFYLAVVISFVLLFFVLLNLFIHSISEVVKK